MPKRGGTFEQKLRRSTRLVRRVLAAHTRPVVACSFGKDSMAVLHLVLAHKPDVPVLWNNTSVEYPDTYRFKAEIERLWNLNVIEARPVRDFWWVVNRYGFPLFSRKGNADPSKTCCRYLKDYPVEKVLRKHKFDLYLTGLRRVESRLRRLSAQKYGEYFYSRRLNFWKCHPIQDWTDEDVWRYHDLHTIPRNPLYEKDGVPGFEVRTACWSCTIPIKHGKVEFLRRNYPKLWKHLLRNGLAKLVLERKAGILDAASIPDDYVHNLIESRPCFFDRL